MGYDWNQQNYLSGMIFELQAQNFLREKIHSFVRFKTTNIGSIVQHLAHFVHQSVNFNSSPSHN